MRRLNGVIENIIHIFYCSTEQQTSTILKQVGKCVCKVTYNVVVVIYRVFFLIELFLSLSVFVSSISVILSISRRIVP